MNGVCLRVWVLQRRGVPGDGMKTFRILVCHIELGAGGNGPLSIMFVVSRLIALPVHLRAPINVVRTFMTNVSRVFRTILAMVLSLALLGCEATAPASAFVRSFRTESPICRAEVTVGNPDMLGRNVLAKGVTDSAGIARLDRVSLYESWLQVVVLTSDGRTYRGAGLCHPRTDANRASNVVLYQYPFGDGDPIVISLRP